MADEYWVVGGEYTDTDFKQIKQGAAEERFGPFDSLEKARAEWSGRSMAQVDNAMVRYRIEHVGETRYWVVGGRYKTTDFKFIAGGGEEERFGPFDDYEDAKNEWQARSMANVDDALTRYRIEQE